MPKHLLDLTIKLCTLPFAELSLYKNDYIADLANIHDDFKYHEKLTGTVQSWLHRVINSSQQLRNEDEVNLLFEKYFSKLKMQESVEKEGISSFYRQLLSEIAKYLLTHRNGKIAFKYWKSDGEEDFFALYENFEKVELWHTLNRCFTTDLLVAAYLLDNKMGEEQLPYGIPSVMLEDIQLDSVLRDGLAETHLHTGAGINFCLSWRQLMNVRRENKEAYNGKWLHNALWVDQKGENMKQRVQSAAFSRLVMAKFLMVGSEEGGSFERNLSRYAEENSNFIKELLEDIYSGVDITYYKWNLFIKQFTQLLKLLDMRPLIRECVDHDILENMLGYKSKCDPEILFLLRALRYMDENPKDEFFGKIFWQYIRIKNAVFQGKVQHGQVKGLDHFQKYYRSSTKFTNVESQEYWRMVLENQLENRNLHKLELRTGFGSEKSVNKIKKSMKKKIRYFLLAYKEIVAEKCKSSPEIKIPQIGLIFHFIKTPDKYITLKCWKKTDTRHANLFYGKLQQSYLRQAQALRELRESIAGLSDYVIGIDAASVENNTEPWVFAPVYDDCRDSSNNRMFYKDMDNSARIKSLGFTFHVGEDFRHLLTGLRHIDETLEHFKFHAGDRIGHAIALGLDVDKWMKNHSLAVMPRIEYLENLLWLWGLLKNGGINFDLSYYEQEIIKQVQKIYQHSNGITIYNLWSAYRKKFKLFKNSTDCRYNRNCTYNQSGCLYVNGNSSFIWDVEKLSNSYHCRNYLEKMLEPVQIPIIDKDNAILKGVQRLIVNKVNRLGIVVETNPTSNISISEMESIFEHYIHNLNNSGLIGDNDRLQSLPTIVTINTDDPSVFNTNLNNEFAYVFYQLLHRKYYRSDILKWIGRVREYGMKSSFLDDRSLRQWGLDEEITRILQKL